jgi:ubiquinone/menaquinone biosynthesis C-methylase UbiE
MINSSNNYRNSFLYYDYDFNNFDLKDIEFYIKLIPKSNTDILELCCGTGRISIPLAEHGFKMTCIDSSLNMLEIFKTKLNSHNQKQLLKSISVVNSLMQEFSLNKQFDCILLPFHSFQNLTTEIDIKKCFDCLRQHLRENGTIILNLFNPLPEMENVINETCTREVVDNNNKMLGKKVTTNTDIDLNNQILFFKTEYIIENNIITDYFETKYYYESQAEILFLENGFIIENIIYGLENNNQKNEMTFVLRKKSTNA